MKISEIIKIFGTTQHTAEALGMSRTKVYYLKLEEQDNKRELPSRDEKIAKGALLLHRVHLALNRPGDEKNKVYTCTRSGSVVDTLGGPAIKVDIIPGHFGGVVGFAVACNISIALMSKILERKRPITDETMAKIIAGYSAKICDIDNLIYPGRAAFFDANLGEPLKPLDYGMGNTANWLQLTHGGNDARE